MKTSISLFEIILYPLATIALISVIIKRIKSKKDERTKYHKLISDISSYGGKDIDSVSANKLLKEAESISGRLENMGEILSAQKKREESMNPERIILFTQRYPAPVNTIEVLALVCKTGFEFPYFYIYGPKSDYDSYDEGKLDQFRLEFDNKEFRIVTHKGATNEIYRIIQEIPEVNLLYSLLQGRGIDIEFCGKNVYIWDFYNDRYNIKADELERVVKVKKLLFKYFVPRLIHVKKDFDYIKEAFVK